VQLLIVRGGKLIGRDRFPFEDVGPDGAGPLLGAFLPQYYLGAREIPRTILMSHTPAEGDLLASMLSARAGQPVTLTVPQRGAKAHLVEMAVGNAAAVLAQSLASLSGRERAMTEVQTALALPSLPRRIEYKRFRIRTVVGADDFAMVREVLRRRLARTEWALPDLLLIDGGRGQLTAGLLAAGEVGVTDLPLASLAKEEELIFRPGRPQPIRLPDGSRGKHLLQQVRDETHRFALAYHRTLRGKAGLHSALDEIPGIGEKRKRQLLQRFGSLKRLRTASADELVRVGGLPARLAEATHRLLNAVVNER
jgi:excinuclease ABC subunit C